MRDRPNVCAFFFDCASRRLAADPIVISSVRVLARDEFIAVDALAKPRDTRTLDLIKGNVGHVDVEKRIGRQIVRQHAPCDARGYLCRRSIINVCAMIRVNGHRDSRDAVNRGFHRRGDGTGVREIVCEVAGGIDAADDERGLVAQQPQHHERDAIGWCAVAAVRRRAIAQPRLIDAQGLVHRLGVTRRAPIAFRRDDDHIAERLQRLSEREQAGRVDAVVVGYEYQIYTPYRLSFESA